MECIASRDENNQCWKDLLDHVSGLNDKLVELSNSHLGNNVRAKLIQHNKMLPKATSGVASACLEVTDAACVVMATMRSIINQHSSGTKKRHNDNSMFAKKKNIIFDFNKKAGTGLPPEQNKLEGILQLMEVALSLSKFKNQDEIFHVLEQAISMMKSIPPVERCSEAVECVDCVKVGKPKTTRNTRVAKHTYRK